MSVTPISRSLRALKRQIVSADEAADVTERLVRLTYADTGSIAKSAANDAGSNERSARNWMEHKCAFSFATFLTLCQNSPKFKAVARKLLAMESALDPATEKSARGFAAGAGRDAGAGKMSGWLPALLAWLGAAAAWIAGARYLARTREAIHGAPATVRDARTVDVVRDPAQARQDAARGGGA